MSMKESQTTKTSAPYTGAQQNILDKALQLYAPQLGAYEPYGGQRVAGLTGTQQEALGGAGGFLDAFSAGKDIPLYGEGGQALQGLLSGQTGAQPITPEMSQDLFSRIYEQPSMQRWQEFGLPGIKEAYSGPGYWSSARAGGEALGARNLSDWLGGKQGEFMWDIEQANRGVEEAKAGRALSALGILPGYAGMPTSEAQQRLAGRGGVFDFAGAEQRQEQAEINAAIQEFAEQYRIADPESMSILMALLGMPYGTSKTTSMQDPSDYATSMAWSGLVGDFILSVMSGGKGGGVGGSFGGMLGKGGGSAAGGAASGVSSGLAGRTAGSFGGL